MQEVWVSKAFLLHRVHSNVWSGGSLMGAALGSVTWTFRGQDPRKVLQDLSVVTQV